MTFLRRFSAFLLVAAMVLSCRKSSNASWDVDMVLPVVSSELNIRNFSGDSLFQAGAGGVLHLKIKREVASVLLDSLLTIPDTIVRSPFSNTIIPVTLKPGEGIPLTPTDLTFNFGNGILLKRADVRSGKLRVKFTNKLTEPIDLIYLLPTVKKSGQAFQIKEIIPSGGQILEKEYDIGGYSMGLRGLNGNQYNTIVQNYTLNISTTASGPALVNTGEVAAIEVDFSSAVPDFVEGYFGQDTITIKADTSELDLINNLRASNFMLSEATMNFSIINEIGAEFTGSLKNVRSINTLQNNNTVTLNNSKLSSINLNRATRAGSQVTASSKLLSFNNSNSNITAFISNLPDKLAYEGEVTLNPFGNISGGNDFAFYNSGIRIIADIDIPLRFTADYLELTTVSEVDFTGAEGLQEVNSGRFVVNARNGFPFSAIVQAYLLDAGRQVLDSVFVPGVNVIERGDVNAQNEVTAPRDSKVYIPITEAKIDKLESCKFIKIVSRFMMPPNPPEIKLLEHYGLDIKIIAELNYNVGL